MPYQVRLDQFIAVTPESAVKLYDNLSADYRGRVSVHDMDGNEIKIDSLRQTIQDNSEK